MKQFITLKKSKLIMVAISLMAAATAIIPVGSVGAIPPPAWDCSSWLSSVTSAHARCNMGLGGVRVWADCHSLGTGITLRKYGDWKPVGQISSVNCYSGTFVLNHGYQTS